MTRITWLLPLPLTALLCLTSHATGKDVSVPQTYIGLCDASAAIAIGPDHFLVANDEDNVLRLYQRGLPDPVKSDASLVMFLDEKRSGREADIEGAAIAGKRIYWITSHGANSEGKMRPERHRLFATDFTITGNKLTLSPVGHPFSGLVPALSDARNKSLQKYNFAEAATKAPELKSALNIEGLAISPEGKLLIGFRNPIPDGKALVLPIENPDELFAGIVESSSATRTEMSPRFGTPVELDLGGLGIRSIEYAKALNAYLIVAGPYDNSDKFRLFKWEYHGGKAPQELSVNIAVDDFRPEAIFGVAEEGRRFQVLSDDGGRIYGGKECKSLSSEDQRKFRSIEIQL